MDENLDDFAEYYSDEGLLISMSEEGIRSDNSLEKEDFLKENGGVYYKRFKNRDLKNTVLFSDIFVAIWENDQIQFSMKIKSKNSITIHNGVYIGPYINVKLYSKDDVILLDWDVGQINFDCQTDYVYRKDNQQQGIFKKAYGIEYSMSKWLAKKC